MRRLCLPILAALSFLGACALASAADAPMEILVTYDNDGARAGSAAAGAPYRKRRRYAISAQARRAANAVEREYGLESVSHWPIRSLAIYCYVYRVPADRDANDLIDSLAADSRVESVQLRQRFETGTAAIQTYNDTYANLQHGIGSLNLHAAHLRSLGSGVRIAVVDSDIDQSHEDLSNRVRRMDNFADDGTVPDDHHGTAVTSVIAALANNETGIVGVAPDASVDLYVACWSSADTDGAVCDSFTLAKAIDAALEDPPHILNLSLTGPDDPLLSRLLKKAHALGVVIVAAMPNTDDEGNRFPASMGEVIAVDAAGKSSSLDRDCLYAPGDRILVAVPDDGYDFRSGSSLAAAHVSGVVALLLSASPGIDTNDVLTLLRQSQQGYPETGSNRVSIDACRTLRLAGISLDCGQTSELESQAQRKPGA